MTSLSLESLVSLQKEAASWCAFRSVQIRSSEFPAVLGRNLLLWLFCVQAAANHVPFMTCIASVRTVLDLPTTSSASKGFNAQEQQ